MYIKVNERQKRMCLFNEMEKIENEYHSANAKAMEYLKSRQDDRSSAASEILSIDLLEQMNILESPITTRKEGMDSRQYEGVGTLFLNAISCDILPISEPSPIYHAQTFIENGLDNRSFHDSISCPLGLWVSFWNFETIRGSLMKPKW